MKRKSILQKILSGVLILLLAVHLFAPAVVLAQEVTPTDTPTPTPTVDASATPTDTPTDTPTPAPTVDPNATPAADPSITIDPNASDSSVAVTNNATVSNDTSSTSNTGSNAVSSGSNVSQPVSTPTPTPTPQVTVQTGDAVSVVAGSNTINTTSINSNVTDQTINIYGDQTGNIDLSTLFQLVSSIITNDNNTSPVINVQVNGVNNYAYLSNDVVSSANTGNNTVNGTGGSVVVNTGNAESVVSLINKVNLTVVNSSLHLVTINIFGHLSGNIILPNIASLQSTTCSSCGVSFNTNNQAVVNNSVGSTANTGTNTLNASGDATLTTGNAQSDVNTVNIVNQTVLGMIFESLFINEFGYWNGNFLGWDGIGAQPSGTMALSAGLPNGGATPTGTLNSTTVNNTAYVNNNISSLANTGGNKINGQNVGVTTGSAYSAVSLINFINSNFMNTLGFFGFINIFGNWDGNIGGADMFVTPTPTPTQDAVVVADSAPQIEDGGALSQTNENNVGAYVLPGDTVTFFLKTKNIGTGKVYGAKLNLFLILNGVRVGGASYNLGDIGAGKGVKVTTGLVLSKNAAPGNYIARAEVTGTTGPEATPVSAAADSTFTIFGSTLTAQANTTLPTPPVLHKAVLAATTNHNANTDMPLYFALLAVLLAYVGIRVIRAREQLVLLFTPGANLKSRLNMLRLFLL